MKQFAISLLLIPVLLISGILIFNACSKVEQPIPSQSTDQVLDDKLDAEYDDEVIDDLVVGDESTFTNYCSYEITKIIKADGTYLTNGDILCYQCPSGNKCERVADKYRKLRYTVTIDGVTTVEYYEVEITGGGGTCSSCPAGGKVVNQVLD